jgi:hypothetical protein
MPLHVFGFYKQLPANASPQEIDVIQDDVLTRTATTRFMIPPGLKRLYWVYGAQVKAGEMYIQTPSLISKKFYLRVIPRRIGDTAPDKTSINIMIPKHPIDLAETEEISIIASNSDTSSVSDNIALLALGVDALPSVPAGERRIIKATGTTTIIPYRWTSVKLTPEVQLEAGEYALVRLLGICNGCIGVRAIIPGQVWRPGSICISGVDPSDLNFTREYLDLLPEYDMGHFTHLAIPEVQFLAKTGAASETVYMEIVKVR